MKKNNLFFIICLLLMIAVFSLQYSFDLRTFSTVKAAKEAESNPKEEICFRENINNNGIALDRNLPLAFNLSYSYSYISWSDSTFNFIRFATFLDVLFNHSPPKNLR